MDKLLAGPLGLVLVLAQVALFVYLLRGMFEATEEDVSLHSPLRGKPRRGEARERARRPEASSEGSHGWRRASRILETFHDADSGAMSGVVLTGPFAGRRLEDLSRPDCLRLQEFCREAGDDYATMFIQAYTNHRFAGAFSGGAEGFSHRERMPRKDDGGPMTRERAYQALGLASGASDEEIHDAYRALIKKHHPDHGGSTAMAALINEAKDFLVAKAH